MKDGQKSPSCDLKNRCLKKDCGKKHHSSLHRYFDDKAIAEEAASKDDKDGAGKEDSGLETKALHVGMLNSSPRRIFLQIVPVRLFANNETYRRYLSHP